MPDTLDSIEARYRAARDIHDQAEIAAARGDNASDLRSRAAQAALAFGEALDAMRADDVEAVWRDAVGSANTVDSSAADSSSTADSRGRQDRAALAVMLSWAGKTDAPTVTVPHETSQLPDPTSFADVSARIEAAYAQAQGAVEVNSGETMTRLGVLEQLSIDVDPARRRALFLALDPVWRTIDGDGQRGDVGSGGSPYQSELLPLSVRRWAAGGSPIDRNARALGIEPTSVEPSLLAILDTWRRAFAGDAPIEPWDWWYAAGAASRALRMAIPLDRIRECSDAYHASLGADPKALGVSFDVFPRAGRPPVPVAYTDFGGRPDRRADGSLVRAKACVMGTYTTGGLGELSELIHETGHAIHIAAIDTRPAFADWPDSDAFTEALAELTALDTAEPTWQQHWLGTSVRADVSLRGRYADVMLDICWAVLEMRLHASPDLRPNDVWTELTSHYLGIVAHPELSWWAMRGQLVQEPGYMVNYALGPILAADMRAAIRDARGDWATGDPGWYAWVSDRVYRWGLERTSGDVLADLLGRAPTPDALVAEIRRGVHGAGHAPTSNIPA
jgi:hypothetical protein